MRALLFDKDGTLVENHGAWVGQMVEMLATLSEGDDVLLERLAGEVGIDLEQRKVIPMGLVAQATFEDVARKLGACLPDRRQEDLLDRLLRSINDDPDEAIVALPGAVETLSRLAAQGYTVGIISNDSEARIEQTVRVLGLECIDYLAGADSGYGGKPEPGMICRFLDAGGFDPSEVAVIGDSPADMLAAEAAGIGVKIGISADQNDPVLGHYTPHILPDLRPLPELLECLARAG